jgi:ATP-dependent helicase/nuclease subunit A
VRRNEPSILTAGAGTSVPASPSRAWTPAQLRGIQTTGRSLLVSAAAGSGKTAVLAQRCAHLVCDADDACDVDELLVVTFTEAAAAEMKSRIGRALRARARAAPSDRLTHQLALLDRASISTLHGFCSRLLRQHFHAVGLDPGFSVLDADDARLLRNEVARQLFADRYELDDHGTFQRLVDCYADGNDERLVRLVLHVHEMLNSLVDRDGWIERSLRRIAEAADAPVLGTTELGRELHAFIASGLNGIIRSCDDAIAQLPRLGDFRKYVDLLRDHRVMLGLWQKKLDEHGVNALAAEAALFQPPKLPPVRNDVPNKDAAKAAVDAVRGAMKAGPWRDCLRFTAAEWRDGLRAVLPHAREFLSLVEQFERFYRLRKDASRSVDFADLERLALKAMRDPAVAEALAPSPAARACHKRFRHVLVDEYQDINEVQDAILTLLSRECVRGEPGTETNLFSVGDVKQSIYRFRLAEPTRFLEREKAFRGNAIGPDSAPFGEVIDLQANFRSRAPLLKAVNAVFERLMTAEAADIAYDASHRLHAGRTFADAPEGACCFRGAPIELHLLPKKLDAQRDDPPDRPAPESEADCDTAPADDGDDLDRAEREALLVARRIREMMRLEGRPPMCVSETGPDGAARYRPMRYGDMVILLRSMKHKADEYAEVLEAAGIPVHSESSTGYFESTEVRDMLALLALLDNQRQDVPLASVLRSPLAELGRPEDAMARVRLAYPAGKNGPAFHEACRRYAAERDDELAAWLRAFFGRLGRWRALAQRRPLADLIGAAYDDTGYLTYVGALHNGRQRVANLTYLRDRAAQFGSFHRQGLSRFLQFLDSLREESDLGQPSVAGEAEDVVRIMSVHRSKGLEFPVVFLPDLGKAINLQDCVGAVLADRRAGLGMAVVDDVKRVRYPSLASTLVQHRLRQQALAEELRVLYVAMTRAQEHLVMVGTCGTEAPARWTARWKGHAGPLPADAVLGATTMLDWVGPVAAATSSSAGEVFEATFHGAAEVAAWRHPSQAPKGDGGRAAALARLEPLDPPPPPNAVADEVARRLTQTYAHAAATRGAAARAMTETGPRKGAAAPAKSPLLCAGVAGTPAADEVGTATHRVLRNLDFRRPASAEDVAVQVRELVERRLLSPAEEAVVDVDALVWLMESEVGRLLRDHYGQLRRELPVYAAAAQLTSDDPADRVMLRGRIDVLVPLGDRLLVVDYKTDAVAADEVTARAELYRPQVERYADAISRATAKPVVTKLVFLRARSCVDV